jgi:hypothetical protein
LRALGAAAAAAKMSACALATARLILAASFALRLFSAAASFAPFFDRVLCATAIVIVIQSGKKVCIQLCKF